MWCAAVLYLLFHLEAENPFICASYQRLKTAQ
nr:MAG TPA: hypothetical protein [Caudoviricetes sp.]